MSAETQIETADGRQIIARFPLSTTQQRCWFLDQMQPGNPALNVAVRWEVTGTLRESDLEQAFQAVIDRHEILRTRFVEVDGTPEQQVVEQVAFKLDVVDLRRIPEDDQLDRVNEIAIDFSDKPFDLGQPGLIRAALVKLAADRAMLIYVVHQTCFDGFSIRVLGQELGAAAQAIALGQKPDLPELPLQYGDYSLWQRDYLSSGVLEEETAYWLKALENLSYFEVPPDKPRPAIKSTKVDHVFRVLPDNFGANLQRAAKQLGVSTFTFGTAIFSACLAKITGERDILFGTQIAGRLDTDLEGLIGVFINNMVLRFDTDLAKSVTDHVAAAKVVVEGALSHQTMPFNVLVERLNPRRDPSRTPLISVNFNLQSIFMENKSYEDFALKSSPSHAPGAIYDLDLAVMERAGRSELSLDYSVSLFERSTAEAILDAVFAAFELAFDKPDASLADMQLPDSLEARGAGDRQTMRSAKEMLETHPHVQEAAVLRDGDGLYGFVVPGETGTVPLELLPRRISDFAAEQGNPLTGVSLLGAFPRKGAGEINTSVLQIPAQRMQATDEIEARTDILQALKADWSDILSIPTVASDSHFFDLGGHSVLVLRQLTKIRERWGVKLDVNAVYENPFLSDLARLITLRLHTPKAAPTEKDWRFMTLAKDGKGQPLVVINNAATGQALSRLGAVKRPVFCARVAEADRGLTVTDQTFEDIAAAYAEVVETSQPDGPYLLYGNCVHGNLALETARILQARGAEIAGVVMKDVWEPGYAAAIHSNRKARKAEKWFTLRARLKAVRQGEMSWSTLVRFYGIAHKLWIVSIGTKLGLMERVHKTDLDEEQEEFISAVSAKRNVYRPAPINFPVLHIVTGITPTGRLFKPSVGWEDVVEDDKLRTVALDKVMVMQDRRIGVDKMAAEIEAFLGES